MVIQDIGHGTSLQSLSNWCLEWTKNFRVESGLRGMGSGLRRVESELRGVESGIRRVESGLRGVGLGPLGGVKARGLLSLGARISTLDVGSFVRRAGELRFSGWSSGPRNHFCLSHSHDSRGSAQLLWYNCAFIHLLTGTPSHSPFTQTTSLSQRGLGAQSAEC